MLKTTLKRIFFKLMNNAVFGKTGKLNKSCLHINLVHTEQRLTTVVCQALIYRFKIFNADLVEVENKKVKLLLNKPVYIGQTILDLSKLVIYDFHYNFMKHLYEDNIKLLFTDTDCLMYEIETPNLNEDIVKYNSMFDLSNYPVDHPLHDDANKKIVLKFKNETAGNL